MRQLLTETLLLSALGGAVGLMLARWLLALFMAAAPAPAGGFSQGVGAIPLLSGAEITGWVTVMTLVTCLVTATACGLLPAVRIVRSDPQDGLKVGGLHGGRRGASGQLLVSLELSMALVLLIGAGLMAGTMSRISEIPLGFEPGAVQVLGARLDHATYSTLTEGRLRSLRPERNALVTRVVQQLAALPAVEVAAAANTLPMRPLRPASVVHIEGLDREPAGRSRTIDGVLVHGRSDLVRVTPDYFRAMGIRHIQGRTFSTADDRSASLVAIVNQRLVDDFELENPLGRRIKVRDGITWRSAAIVGVVGSAYGSYPQHLISEQWTGAKSTVYLPFTQPAEAYRYSFGSQMSIRLIARHVGDGQVVRNAMREMFRRTDPESPITFVASMEDFVGENLVDRRFHLFVVSFLAAVSLLLAIIGVYGVMAFQVGQRVHEIGVRMALGAKSTGVVRMVVGEGLRVAALGALMGVAGAMAATRLLSNWLYGVSPTDPVVFVGLAGVMVGAAVIACLIPARRAARVVPMASLRAE